MGSPETEEGHFHEIGFNIFDSKETQHEVTLTQGFWIAETVTTQELWRMAMGDHYRYCKIAQLPADNVTWNDCQEFVEILNRNFRSALPSGYKFAMPTEAQWEYACRADTTTPFNIGESLNTDKANFNGNHPYGTITTITKIRRFLETTLVKSYPPNAWGLFDMHGNVEEWCSDWSGPYDTSASATIDPTGPIKGKFHVVRGGSVNSFAINCRSADRGRGIPDRLLHSKGFRLVLVRDSQPCVPLSNDSVTVSEPRQTEYVYPSGDAPESTRVAGAIKTLEIAGVSVNFHWAPAGTFLMGSAEDKHKLSTDEIQHEVALTQGFWIAETLTTQEFWQAVMGNNLSHYEGSDQLPVENLRWFDCQDFVNTLNERYGSALPCGYEYAMPTEAQWEYACRAGGSTLFYPEVDLFRDSVNCNGKTSDSTTLNGHATPVKAWRVLRDVKSYAPNAWGLYYMRGLSEWIFDWFDSNYYANPSAMKDPVGPDVGFRRVLRGGDYSYKFSATRRSCAEPCERMNWYGFRLVLVPSSSQR